MNNLKNKYIDSNLLLAKLWALLSINLFLIPNLLSINIITILVLLLSQKKYRQLFFESFIVFSNWVMASFFIMQLLSVIYSSNVSNALNEIVMKLSFLLAPFLAYSSMKILDFNQFKFILKAFIISILSIFVVCLIHGIYLFYDEIFILKQELANAFTNSFLYNRFSYFHHPTYLSIYVLFGIHILLYGKFLNIKFCLFQYKNLCTILILLFLIFIVLLASKAAYISLLISLIIFGFSYFQKIKKIILPLIAFSSLIILISSFYIFNNEINFKINSTIAAVKNFKHLDQNDFGSSVTRLWVWHYSLNAIKEAPLLGFGIGDAKEILVQQYLINDYKHGFNEKLNSHNQFLQTILASGLLGLLSLLIFFVYPLAQFKFQNYLLLILVLIIFINLFFESLFERQAGTIFSAFYICLLFYFPLLNNQNTKLENNV